MVTAKRPARCFLLKANKYALAKGERLSEGPSGGEGDSTSDGSALPLQPTRTGLSACGDGVKIQAHEKFLPAGIRLALARLWSPRGSCAKGTMRRPASCTDSSQPACIDSCFGHLLHSRNDYFLLCTVHESNNDQ